MNHDQQTKLAMGAGLGTIALAAAAYFGLTVFAPGKKVEKKAEGVTSEAVFANNNAAGATAETAAAAPAGETPAASASDAPTAASNTPAADPVSVAAEATASAVSAAASGSGALTADEARKIGEEVARQVATQVAQKIVDDQLAKGGGGAAMASGGGLTADEARAIGREEGRKVAEEVARSVVAGGAGAGATLTAEQAEQIGLAAGRRAARQVAAKTAREVVRKEFGGTMVAASAASAETPAAAAPEVAPAAAAGKHSRKRGGRNSEAGADALRAWWPATSAGDFGLVYAGQPKGEDAIALLFSNAPNTSALGDGVKVYDAKGKVVSGRWEAAANPRLMVFRGVKPGRYTVVVQPTLADASGKAIGKSAAGPVYITT